MAEAIRHNGIRDLVADLVRVATGYLLRSKQHRNTPYHFWTKEKERVACLTHSDDLW